MDIDLHVVVSEPRQIENVDWVLAFPRERFCLKIVRPATGGVPKVIVLFATGQIELVLIPASSFYLARLAMSLGLHRRLPRLQSALDEVHTTIQSGYCFLKGEKIWGEFYRRIFTDMPGVRLRDFEARHLAEVFLCELMMILQKLERHELAAAQHALHRSLAEANFRLTRELRQRRNEPLPSFGLARHVERSLTPEELAWVRIDARLDSQELRRAAKNAFEGLKALMRELVPSWRVPDGFDEILALRARDPL